MADTLPYELSNSNDEEEELKRVRAVADNNAAVDTSDRAGFESLATTGIHHPSVNTDMGILEAIADIGSTSDLVDDAQVNGITDETDAVQDADYLAEISALQTTIARVLQEAGENTAAGPDVTPDEVGGQDVRETRVGQPGADNTSIPVAIDRKSVV